MIIKDDKGVIDLALRHLTFIEQDIQVLQKAHFAIKEAPTSQFTGAPCFHLNIAIERLKDVKENLWAILGNACGHNLRNIINAVEEKEKEADDGAED